MYLKSQLRFVTEKMKHSRYSLVVLAGSLSLSGYHAFQNQPSISAKRTTANIGRAFFSSSWVSYNPYAILWNRIYQFFDVSEQSSHLRRSPTIPSDTPADFFSSGLIATSAMSTRAEILVKSESNRAHGTNSNMEDALMHQERQYATETDIFYQKHKTLPNPKIMHDSLDNMIRHENCRRSMNTEGNQSPIELKNNSLKILVIGDVHGCFNEMKTLVEKASKDYNSNQSFAAVVLVGDLCNKGPLSAEVVRYVRTQPYWYSVRGNHDNAALSAALGDEKRRDNGKYKWVSNLSDEDVHWLANLPYTITIPRSMIMDKTHNEDDANNRMDEDIIIVHAGLIPGVPLAQQDVKTMTTIREVIEVKNKSNSLARNGIPRIGTHNQNIKEERGCSQRQNEHVEGLSYEYYSNFGSDENKKFGEHYPWATVWQGPQQIIFGHDAKRGFQNQNFALGLDTGCCYGKKLTGIILPDERIVHVDAEKIHSPIRNV